MGQAGARRTVERLMKANGWRGEPAPGRFAPPSLGSGRDPAAGAFAHTALSKAGRPGLPSPRRLSTRRRGQAHGTSSVPVEAVASGGAESSPLELSAPPVRHGPHALVLSKSYSVSTTSGVGQGVSAGNVSTACSLIGARCSVY